MDAALDFASSVSFVPRPRFSSVFRFRLCSNLVFENRKMLPLNPLEREIRDADLMIINSSKASGAALRPATFVRISVADPGHRPMAHAGSSWFLDVAARIPEDGTGTMGRPVQPINSCGAKFRCQFPAEAVLADEIPLRAISHVSVQDNDFAYIL